MTSARHPVDAPWSVTALLPDIQVTCHEVPTLVDSELEMGIETVWQEALKKHPRLYNGRVFCLSQLQHDRLGGFWCEYRWALAQMRAPELAVRLQLRSLAVTGLLVCRDGIVLGRRNPNSLYLPGFWQGVPAGSVEARSEKDPIDLRAQLLAELEEEIGLTDAVTLTGPLLACEHDTTHIVDLGFRIDTDLPFEAVREAWQKKANDEYDQLECHALDRIDLISPQVLPTTRAMLERLAQ